MLVVFTVIVCSKKPAAAQNGAWCAYYNTADGGSRNCGFATFEQCLATVRGVGGNCSPSPYPSSTPSRRGNTVTERSQSRRIEPNAPVAELARTSIAG